MEKISNIVRGNSRVSSVDLRSSSAVRPGVPTFGRPVGASSGSLEREGTTAARAAQIQSQMTEQRRTSQDGIVTAMADQFFMSRIRRPEEGVVPAPTAQITAAHAPTPNVKAAEIDAAMATEADETVGAIDGAFDGVAEAPAERYTPRGTYVDVRA